MQTKLNTLDQFNINVADYEKNLIVGLIKNHLKKGGEFKQSQFSEYYIISLDIFGFNEDDIRKGFDQLHSVSCWKSTLKNKSYVRLIDHPSVYPETGESEFYILKEYLNLIHNEIMMLRIKEALKAKGMTQVDFAKTMNMSVVGLNKIINGNPTVESLQKIAEVLNVEVKELFKSESKGQVNGFIEYDNTIYKIKSKEDLKNVLSKM